MEGKKEEGGTGDWQGELAGDMVAEAVAGLGDFVVAEDV